MISAFPFVRTCGYVWTRGMQATQIFMAISAFVFERLENKEMPTRQKKKYGRGRNVMCLLAFMGVNLHTFVGARPTTMLKWAPTMVLWAMGIHYYQGTHNGFTAWAPTIVLIIVKKESEVDGLQGSAYFRCHKKTEHGKKGVSA